MSAARGVLIIVGRIALAFGVAFVLAAGVWNDLRLAMFGLVVGTAAGSIYHCLRLLDQGRGQRAMGLFARMLLMVAIAGTLAYPAWVPTMCILPLMAVGVGGVFFDRTPLRTLVFSAIATEAVVIGLYFIVPPAHGLPEWAVIAFSTAHFFAAIGVTIHVQWLGAVALRDRAEEAEAAHRRNELFITNMSHEVRTPLNSVLGFAELLRDGEYGTLPAPQLGFAHNIVSSATHLKRVCDELLELQQVKEHGVALGPVALREVTRETLQVLDASVGARTVDLDVVVPEVEVHANPRALRQVLVNLIQNATAHTAEGTRIALRACVEPPAAVISVHDHGPGMPPAHVASIFNYFGSSTPLDSGSPRSTGPGLALTKALVQRMNGDIRCESAPGQGTTFSIRVPLEHP